LPLLAGLVKLESDSGQIIAIAHKQACQMMENDYTDGFYVLHGT